LIKIWYKYNRDGVMELDKAILVRFRSEDFQMLREQSKERGLSMGAFIRTTVLQVLKKQIVDLNQKQGGA